MKKWVLSIVGLVILSTVSLGTTQGQSLIPIEEEHRCTDYNSRIKSNHYRYSQSIEPRIVEENLGGRIYSPYTNQQFNNLLETQIEHIVAAAEAHDSGLCAENIFVRRRFAQDMLNLTLASPRINRQKSARDPAEWLPPLRKVWFVETVIQVKSKYGLSMDAAEAQAVIEVLEDKYPFCQERLGLQRQLDCYVRTVTIPSYTTEPTATPEPTATATRRPQVRHPVVKAQNVSKIPYRTCAEWRRSGRMPKTGWGKGIHKEYNKRNDRNNNGWACGSNR